MKDVLQWNFGGDGWGACAIGNMFAALVQKPKILPYSVLIGISKESDKDDFTTEELQTLLEISEKETKRHIEIVGEVRASDNLITIRKDQWGWSYKRRSWTSPERFNTLEELKKALTK